MLESALSVLQWKRENIQVVPCGEEVAKVILYLHLGMDRNSGRLEVAEFSDDFLTAQLRQRHT
jgi:hypothetical protein